MTRDGFLTGLGIALLAGCGVLSALLELLLIPLYADTTLVPITVLFAVGGNIVLVWLGKSLVPDRGLRLAPFVAWAVTVLVISLFPRPEGDVILPGGGGGLEWVGYGVLLGGLCSGVVAAVLMAPRPQPRPTAKDAQPAQPVKG